MKMPTAKFLELAPKWLEGHKKTNEMCERGMKLAAEGKLEEALALAAELNIHMEAQENLKKEILVEVMKFDPENADRFIKTHGIDVSKQAQEELSAVKIEGKTGIA